MTVHEEGKEWQFLPGPFKTRGSNPPALGKWDWQVHLRQRLSNRSEAQWLQLDSKTEFQRMKGGKQRNHSKQNKQLTGKQFHAGEPTRPFPPLKGSAGEAARAGIFELRNSRSSLKRVRGSSSRKPPPAPFPTNPAHWVRPVPPGYSPDSLPT